MASALRNVLLLEIAVLNDQAMDDMDFEIQLTSIFQAKDLHPEMKAQLHCARHGVNRLGQDRGRLRVAAPLIFGGSLSKDCVDMLFCAYSRSSELYRISDYL